MFTGESGPFGLETIKPGHYLNGSQYRPAPIHLIVRHPETAVVRDAVAQIVEGIRVELVEAP